MTEGKTIPANQPVFSVIAQGYLPPIVGWILAAIVVVAALLHHVQRPAGKSSATALSSSPLYLDLLKTLLFAGAGASCYVYMVNQYNGIPIRCCCWLVAAVIMAYVSNNTRFGRYAYAIGGNREAARLSGINIRRNSLPDLCADGLPVRAWPASCWPPTWATAPSPPARAMSSTPSPACYPGRHLHAGRRRHDLRAR